MSFKTTDKLASGISSEKDITNNPETKYSLDDDDSAEENFEAEMDDLMKDDKAFSHSKSEAIKKSYLSEPLVDDLDISDDDTDDFKLAADDLKVGNDGTMLPPNNKNGGDFGLEDESTTTITSPDINLKELDRLVLDAGSSSSDFGAVRLICRCKPLPQKYRSRVWQICLNISSKRPLSPIGDIYDLPEQEIIREDCREYVSKLTTINSESDRISYMADLESILTHHSKTIQQIYRKNNGWLTLLGSLLTLELSREKVYACFAAIHKRYICSNLSKMDIHDDRDRKNETGELPQISSSSHSVIFHLMRLLILYHDPELCSFLDSRRFSPEQYCGAWLRSLFTSHCSSDVVLPLLDVYFQIGDPFLVMFFCLVMLINSKDTVIPLREEPDHVLLHKISSVPMGLDSADIEDFVELAQYYAARTPRTFRHLYRDIIFPPAQVDDDEPSGIANDIHKTSLIINGGDDSNDYSGLCLPVSPEEALQANNLGNSSIDGVRFFVIDCRPIQQYESGHLIGSFHLDSSLMLADVSAFGRTVGLLLEKQRQLLSLDAPRDNLGQHLCFMGQDENDQYLHMVIAHLLQKQVQYVSMIKGGFAAVHEALADNLEHNLESHLSDRCLICIGKPLNQQQRKDPSFKSSPLILCDNSTAKQSSIPPPPVKNSHEGSSRNTSNTSLDFPKIQFRSTAMATEEESGANVPPPGRNDGANSPDILSAGRWINRETQEKFNKFVGRFKETMKVKGGEMKERIVDYIKNESPEQRRFERDGGGSRFLRGGARPYRNMANVFSIGEDEEGDDATDGSASSPSDFGQRRTEVVALQLWLHKPEVINTFECNILNREAGTPARAHILLTSTHLYILRPLPNDSTLASIHARRPLQGILKITSKKRHPEVITLKHGEYLEDVEGGFKYTSQDQLLIPEAPEATKAIKQQIMKIWEEVEQEQAKNEAEMSA